MVLYCHKEGYWGKILPVVIFTKKLYNDKAEPVFVEFEQERILSFHPRVIILEDFDEEEILNSKIPQLIPILPLCKISPQRIRSQAKNWRFLIENSLMDESEKKSLISLL